jgi:hypothetical protein
MREELEFSTPKAWAFFFTPIFGFYQDHMNLIEGHAIQEGRSTATARTRMSFMPVLMLMRLLPKTLSGQKDTFCSP